MMIEDIGIASYGALGQIFSLWKFDQLILKKIIITVATSLQISDFKAKMHQIPTSAGELIDCLNTSVWVIWVCSTL